MKIKFSLYEEAYMIAGDWSDFVSEHKLQARDVICVFRVVQSFPNDKHYFFDYVRAGEVGTRETPPPRAGKVGSGSRGGSKSHHHRGLSIRGGMMAVELVATAEAPRKGGDGGGKAPIKAKSITMGQA